MTTKSSLLSVVPLMENKGWAIHQGLHEASLQVLKSLEANLRTVSNVVK